MTLNLAQTAGDPLEWRFHDSMPLNDVIRHLPITMCVHA